MDAMEKIVEALRSANKKCKARKTCQECKQYGNGLNCVYLLMADELISCGVTVQEWVSVKDRLPETGEYVACIAKRNPFSMFMPMVARIKKNGWVNPITEQYISEVTHWMPLPDPPEEVQKK